MVNPTIFITYNPRSSLEQTLAVRLHTSGVVNGFKMYLPERGNSEISIDYETKRRIEESNYFVIFSFSKLSKVVLEEINYAYQKFNDKSKIIVIFHSSVGKTIRNPDHFTQFLFDPLKEPVDSMLRKIMDTIFQKFSSETAFKKRKEKELQNNMLALLGIGLGLFALSRLAK
jgi:hypothetical protein